MTSSTEALNALNSFKKLGLSDVVVTALYNSHPFISKPTQIQRIGIPLALRPTNNTVFASHTGSGKTLAYLLPLVHNIKQYEIDNPTREKKPRAIILLPNRELSSQTLHVVKQLAHYAKFSSVELIGGERWGLQRDNLEKKVDLVIASPQRLLLHKEKHNLHITDVRHLVVDEADTLLEKDFAEDLDKVLKMMSTRRTKDPSNPEKLIPTPLQTIFVSASLTTKLEESIRSRIPNIRKVITETVNKPSAGIRHEFIVSPSDKKEILLQTLQRKVGKRTMVFCNTVDSCRAVEYILRENNFSATSLHGDIPFETRTNNWTQFHEGKVDIIVCTDIASRGLDTTYVDHVILFDFPHSAVDYLHRVGRTARIGGTGLATSFVTKKDRVLATGIKNAIDDGVSLEELTSNKADYNNEGRLKSKQPNN